jgi:predicted SpoU family rRNA methylase
MEKLHIIRGYWGLSMEKKLFDEWMKLISKFEMFNVVTSMNIYGCEIDDIMKLLR